MGTVGDILFVALVIGLLGGMLSIVGHSLRVGISPMPKEPPPCWITSRNSAPSHCVSPTAQAVHTTPKIHLQSNY